MIQITEIDLGTVAQLVTAVVASGFALLKAIMALVKAIAKKNTP